MKLYTAAFLVIGILLIVAGAYLDVEVNITHWAARIMLVAGGCFIGNAFVRPKKV